MSPAGDQPPARGTTPTRRKNLPKQSSESEPTVRSDTGTAALASGFSPDWNIGPGEILQDELDARNLTQAELALRTGLTPKHINQVIKGVASLSADTALRLERALGIPSHVWNSLEAIYQDHRMRERARDGLAGYVNWLRHFPVSELTNRGIFQKNEDEPTRLEKLLAFFRVADPDAYDRVWTEPVAAGFRRSQHHEVDPYATAVWIRFGEIAAETREHEPYDSSGFAQLLPKLTHLTRLSDDSEAFAQLQQECAQVGVAVEYQREVKGTRANGVVRWLNPSLPMILLSERYRYHDIFWFSFFHEAAHLLLHPKRKTIVHVKIGGDNADGHETEADEYAANLLVPPQYSTKLGLNTTDAEVRDVARNIGVDPGIVAGHLAYRYDTWSRYTRLRRKLGAITT